MDKEPHRFIHSCETKIKRITSDAGKLISEVSTACKSVYEACGLYARSGRRLYRRKTSLSNVNVMFNDEIQAYFIVVNLRGLKNELHLQKDEMRRTVHRPNAIGSEYDVFLRIRMVLQARISRTL